MFSFHLNLYSHLAVALNINAFKFWQRCMASIRTFSTSTLSINSRASCSPRLTPTSPLSEYEFEFGILNDAVEVDSYILVTGGLGYIGSHTTLELLKAGNNVIVIDDLSNSHSIVLDRIKHLVHNHCTKIRKPIPALLFHRIDYRDTPSLRAVLDQFTLQPWSQPDCHTANRSRINGVIHFAAYKAVAESIRLPLSYYANNVAGLIGFLEILSEYGIKSLVFSSSATVYGEVNGQESSGIAEEFCVHSEELYTRDGEIMQMQQGCRGLTNPYGRTKWMCEAILSDLCVSGCTTIFQSGWVPSLRITRR